MPAAETIRRVLLAALMAGAATLARAEALEDAFRAAWRETGVHPALLRAVALTESGYQGAPWPWTINVAGRGFYFSTREEAYRAAEWLMARGVRRFDLGVMQVNWHYNGWRFENLWQALDPMVNVRVAAEILRENHAAAGSWTRAVMWYHNRVSEALGRQYLSRFLRHFEREIARHGKEAAR